jgi:hypothetical protein
MLKIAKFAAAFAAIVLGWPLGVLLVELVCTAPAFGYCGGHENAAVVYVSSWVLAALPLWLAFRSLLNRVAAARASAERRT